MKKTFITALRTSTMQPSDFPNDEIYRVAKALDALLAETKAAYPADYENYDLNVLLLAKELGLQPHEAEQGLNELIAAGLIRAVPDELGEGWQFTAKGKRWARNFNQRSEQ